MEISMKAFTCAPIRNTRRQTNYSKKLNSGNVPMYLPSISKVK